MKLRKFLSLLTALRLAEKILLCLPRQSALRLGRGLGTIAYYFFKKRRDIGLNNLQRALGTSYALSERKIIIRELFQHLGMNIIEFLRFSEINTLNLSQFVQFHQWNKLQQAYEQNKGVIVLTAHLGNWELLAASVGLLGFNTSMVVKSARQKFMNHYLIRQRSQKNITLFSGRQVIRDIFKQLKSGGIVGMVLDQHASRRDSISVPFFNRQASTLKGLAVISQRTQAVILPMYIYRDKNYRHHIDIHDPITHLPQESLSERTEKYMRSLEKAIEKHPEQWIWTHNRWKKGH